MTLIQITLISSTVALVFAVTVISGEVGNRVSGVICGGCPKKIPYCGRLAIGHLSVLISMICMFIIQVILKDYTVLTSVIGLCILAVTFSTIIQLFWRAHK